MFVCIARTGSHKFCRDVDEGEGGGSPDRSYRNEDKVVLFRRSRIGDTCPIHVSAPGGCVWFHVTGECMLAREVGPLGAIASWWGSLACALLYLSFQTRQSKISWRFIAIYSARYIEPKDKALSSSLSSRFAYESEMIRCSE